MHELYTYNYIQANVKVAFEEIPVFCVCRPACQNSSLYHFGLVLIHEAVVLPLVYVAFSVFYQHIVHVHCCVVYNNHILLCDFHLRTHLPTRMTPNL